MSNYSLKIVPTLPLFEKNLLLFPKSFNKSSSSSITIQAFACTNSIGENIILGFCNDTTRSQHAALNPKFAQINLINFNNIYSLRFVPLDPKPLETVVFQINSLSEYQKISQYSDLLESRKILENIRVVSVGAMYFLNVQNPNLNEWDQEESSIVIFKCVKISSMNVDYGWISTDTECIFEYGSFSSKQPQNSLVPPQQFTTKSINIPVNFSCVSLTSKQMKSLQIKNNEIVKVYSRKQALYSEIDKFKAPLVAKYIKIVSLENENLLKMNQVGISHLSQCILEINHGMDLVLEPLDQKSFLLSEPLPNNYLFLNVYPLGEDPVSKDCQNWLETVWFAPGTYHVPCLIIDYGGITIYLKSNVNTPFHMNPNFQKPKLLIHSPNHPHILTLFQRQVYIPQTVENSEDSDNSKALISPEKPNLTTHSADSAHPTNSSEPQKVISRSVKSIPLVFKKLSPNSGFLSLIPPPQTKHCILTSFFGSGKSFYLFNTLIPQFPQHSIVYVPLKRCLCQLFTGTQSYAQRLLVFRLFFSAIFSKTFIPPEFFDFNTVLSCIANAHAISSCLPVLYIIDDIDRCVPTGPTDQDQVASSFIDSFSKMIIELIDSNIPLEYDSHVFFTSSTTLDFLPLPSIPLSLHLSEIQRLRFFQSNLVNLIDGPKIAQRMTMISAGWSISQCINFIDSARALRCTSFESFNQLFPQYQENKSLKTRQFFGYETFKKKIIRQCVEPIRHYEKFVSILPMRPTLLVTGPSGNGKTFFCQWFVETYFPHYPVFRVSGPELLSKYIGSSEANIRNLFQKAKDSSPSFILFDELDSLAPIRGSSTGVTDRVVNQLLTELDGFQQLTNVFLFATSSRPDLIDPALKRPGRFSIQLEIGFPEPDDRRALLTGFFLQRKLTVSDEIVESLVSSTKGYSCADLEQLVVFIANDLLSQNERTITITEPTGSEKIKTLILDDEISFYFDSSDDDQSGLVVKSTNQVVSLSQVNRALLETPPSYSPQELEKIHSNSEKLTLSNVGKKTMLI